MGPPYDKLPIPLPKESLKIWNHPWFSAADILVSGWNKKTRGQLVGCFFYDRRLFFEGKILQEISKLASIEQKKKGPFDFLSKRAHNGKAAANGSESMPSQRPFYGSRKKKGRMGNVEVSHTGLAGAKDQTTSLFHHFSAAFAVNFRERSWWFDHHRYFFVIGFGGTWTAHSPARGTDPRSCHFYNHRVNSVDGDRHSQVWWRFGFRGRDEARLMGVAIAIDPFQVV